MNTHIIKCLSFLPSNATLAYSRISLPQTCSSNSVFSCTLFFLLQNSMRIFSNYPWAYWSSYNIILSYMLLGDMKCIKCIFKPLKLKSFKKGFYSLGFSRRVPTSLSVCVYKCVCWANACMYTGTCIHMHKETRGQTRVFIPLGHHSIVLDKICQRPGACQID